MCEDCLLAKFAWLRCATPDIEAGSIWRLAKANKRPIQIKLMDIDNQVYEVDRLVVDELRELDIFYEGRKFGK